MTNNPVFFSLQNCCVLGTKSKASPGYTEVKQEDNMDKVVEKKTDLKSSKGKMQWTVCDIRVDDFNQIFPIKRMPNKRTYKLNSSNSFGRVAGLTRLA